jgi:hypothetical protein
MNPAVLTTAFEPTELAFLQRFFKSVCAERGVNGDTVAANDLAAQIMALYQQGVRDEKGLQVQLNHFAHSRN